MDLLFLINRAKNEKWGKSMNTDQVIMLDINRVLTQMGLDSDSQLVQELKTAANTNTPKNFQPYRVNQVAQASMLK